MNNVKCKDCLFWTEPDPEVVEAMKDQKTTPNGSCRRHPPTFLQAASRPAAVTLGNAPVIIHDYKVMYAEVREDWWCGEWFDKDEEWPR